MRKEVLDIPIDWLSHDELEAKLSTFVASGKPHQVTTVNPEFIVISRDNNDFHHALQNADLSLADGTGIVLAQTLLDNNPKSTFSAFAQFILLGFSYILTPRSFTYHRITGVELTEQLMELSQANGWRIFLLGAQPGVADKAADMWRAKYEDVQIVGTSPADPDDTSIINEIKQLKPDILLVAYGAPKQDLFIASHKTELGVPIMIGVGGTFDYQVGTIKRPHTLLRALGLEWIGRLIQQPKRFKRIWRSTIEFTTLLIAL